MGLTISVDRSSLSLGPLVITGARATAAAGLWVPAGGYVRPTFAARYAYAPDSAFVPGRQMLAATLTDGTWPLRIRAAAASDVALAALRAAVEAAFGQFSYPATVTLDGVAETWVCSYSRPEWPESRQWRRLGHEEILEVTVPVKPT